MTKALPRRLTYDTFELTISANLFLKSYHINYSMVSNIRIILLIQNFACLASHLMFHSSNY